MGRAITSSPTSAASGSPAALNACTSAPSARHWSSPLYTGKSGIDDAALARTIAAVKNVYQRNVFPSMKVTFGVYPDNLGHITSDGCVRCHNGRTASDDGIVKADLSVPKAMGGPGKPGTATPEHLFAAGYAACFGGALDFVGKQQKKDASKAKIT